MALNLKKNILNELKPIEIIENFVDAYLNIKLSKLNEDDDHIQLLNIMSILKINVK